MHRQAGGQGSHSAQVRLAAAVQAAVLQSLWPVSSPGPACCFPESVQGQASGQIPQALPVLSHQHPYTHWTHPHTCFSSHPSAAAFSNDTSDKDVAWGWGQRKALHGLISRQSQDYKPMCLAYWHRA